MKGCEVKGSTNENLALSEMNSTDPLFDKCFWLQTVRTQRETCGSECVLLCGNSTGKQEARWRTRGSKPCKAMQSFASFCLCHAKTCSRSDVEGTVLNSGVTPAACNLFDSAANLNPPSYPVRYQLRNCICAVLTPSVCDKSPPCCEQEMDYSGFMGRKSPTLANRKATVIYNNPPTHKKRTQIPGGVM